MEMTQMINVIGPLVCGWIADRLIGDPSWLPHPVVGFGKLINLIEGKWNRGRNRILKGGMMFFVLVGGIYCLSYLLLNVFILSPVMLFIIKSVLVFYCLAGTTLSKEVKMVFSSFSEGLAAARKQVSRIVGRDTGSLSENEIKTAALETLAENLSDGVIAPLFWYMILGVPGMLAYKMVNTLDSMVGYKNDRYKEFGCISARMDDIANYIPARITSLLIALTGGGSALRFIFKYGKCHASPNSGYPEAALAGVLNCRFGGTHSYFGEDFYKPYIGEHERSLTYSDLKKSIRICTISEILMVAVVAFVKILIQ